MPNSSAGEWKTILDQASTHGLTHWLQGFPGLPASLQERVSQECLGITARNLALAGELRKLLRTFRGQRVPCLPLRGLALAERLYGDIPPRPMGDIDLLVRKEDLHRVQALFEALGFSEMDRRPGFASAFSYTLKFFVERSVMVIVEPHWTIAYPPFVDRLDMEAVWGRCVPARVIGEQTLSLGREDLLVHLCLHLAHRDDAPLLWLYELDHYLRQESDAMGWDLVLSISCEVGIERLVGHALNEAVAKFEAPVPADVIDSLDGRSGQTRPLAQRLVETSKVDGVESLATFFAVKGLGAKFRYARALLFPQPSFMMLEYGLTHRRQLASTYVRRFCWFSWQAAKGLVQLCLR
ncbi:MAG: nucleotidyltransferase family protein [Chloroflexi bacterium]|nr:nucleotidyltransferase family protein [Chloroflexota bacterium]